jgi:hypothetical protein
MFKRNPDALALALIVCFMAGSSVLSRAAIHRPQIYPIVRVMQNKSEVKGRVRRSVASLKQCFRPDIHHHPTPRSL